MIIDIISDLHGEFPRLDGGDLLIVGGDLTANDSYHGYADFFEWLQGQKYRCKVLIAGNHDNKMCNDLDMDFPEEGIYHLEDSEIQFEGLKIWGTPWSLWFQGINPHCKAFTGSEKDLEKKYAEIPNDIDILISHGPPWGILDQVEKYVWPSDEKKIINVGSFSLRSALERISPKIFVCGHIHEGYGQLVLKNGPKDIKCINASIMDENYDAVNKPVRIIYEPKL